MDDYAEARERLLVEIDEEMGAASKWTGADRLDPAVREAVARVPRHEFVPGWEKPFAYINRPLSIGHGQTISQPFIVALMTHMLLPRADARILEVGTGCGYQTAVLAEIAAEVWSIERIPELAEGAARRLDRLGYGNIHLHTGDGALGWPEAAPFDGILVTAAAETVPPALVDQLAPGGRMAIPVGGPTRGDQVLTLVTRGEDGEVETRPGLPVAFVPLVSGEA